ncbi:MAG: PqqD family protein [Candidatus Aminicenantales bacterium]
MRKEKIKKVNLFDLIPVRNIEWERDEKGLTVLLKPKIKNRFFAKHILHRLINPYYRIRLDSVGSFIWELCDGTQTVREMARLLQEKFGEEVEPLYDRLALFLQSLERNRFIFYSGK